MDVSQTETMKKVFAMFDQGKTGFVETSEFGNILRQLGSNVDDDELQAKIDEVDKESKKMKSIKKEAFRLYDKEGDGFITTQVLKEILKELDPKLTKDDLENIIEEVDEDGSGTVDFDEFMEMMTG
ncbi:troponin C, isoallergen Bla g 6.0101 [Hyalella azteca]|uniref:Troponin C, isoallergen Bla g 6.0101 n=1 Tax=Hyalella azteca TaxID=294128 RepID=A0A8B7PSJ9_HYAAZ|nr:troponin C, isoallergen Bla g 6.0101 [Hyalella azteca]